MDVSDKKDEKIVFITGLPLWSMGNGKGAISFEATINGYRENGFDILVVSDSPIDRDYFNVNARVLNLKSFNPLRSLRYLGWVIRPILWAVFTSYAFFVISFSKKWRNADVFYGYEIYGVPTAVLLSKFFKGLCVSRYQGTILHPLMKNPLWKLRFWEHVFPMWLKTDLVIMADDGTKGEEVLNNIGVDSSRICFWRNGVNINKVRSPEELIAQLKSNLKIGVNKKVICTVSRLVKWKRLDRIIEAMPKIVNIFPSAHLLIVGDGPEREHYEMLVQANGISENVTFAGAVSQADVSKYLQLTDIFVSFYDLSNVGNPLMEAMSLGKAIVTLDNGDTRKLIINNETGILLAPENIKIIPRVVTELLCDGVLSERLGSNAFKLADLEFKTWPERMILEVNKVRKLSNGKK